MNNQSDDAALLADGELLRDCNEAIEAVEEMDALVQRLDELLHHDLDAIERRIHAATARTAAGRALKASVDDGEPRGLSTNPAVVAAIAAARARIEERKAAKGER